MPWLQFPSLPKIHKNSMHMCPIVSACDTAAYNTAKFILKILQNYCGKTSSPDQDITDFIKKIKYLLINPEEVALVSFDVSALLTSILVPVALQVINSKISTCTNFTNVCKILTVKFIKLLDFMLTNCIFCFNKKFYKQKKVADMGSTVSPVIANIYMEYFESLAIPSFPSLIKWWFRYVDDVHSATRKDQLNKLQEYLNAIDPHIKFTIELPGRDGHPISAKLSGIHTIIHRAKQVCTTPEFLAKEMDYLHKVLQDNHYSTQFFQQGKPQQKANKKPNPSTVKFIEGARAVIPYIKGLSE